MDRWKEGYNDCDIAWQRKIKAKVKEWIENDIMFDFSDKIDVEVFNEELEELIKKG